MSEDQGCLRHLLGSESECISLDSKGKLDGLLVFTYMNVLYLKLNQLGLVERQGDQLRPAVLLSWVE